MVDRAGFEEERTIVLELNKEIVNGHGSTFSKDENLGVFP